jgi:hypothetical protein
VALTLAHHPGASRGLPFYSEGFRVLESIGGLGLYRGSSVRENCNLNLQHGGSYADDANSRKSELRPHKAPETDRRILQSSVTQDKLICVDFVKLAAAPRSQFCRMLLWREAPVWLFNETWRTRCAACECLL